MGNIALIALENSTSLYIEAAINTSLIPMFLASISTFSQYFEISFSPIHILKPHFMPSKLIHIAI
ncbi:hypothetical protein VXA87_02185 [Clostridioides difficile]|nr:hypothetical protein [Clostridioides difficile]